MRALFAAILHNAHQFLVCFDQFLNVAICSIVLPWEKSWADETFSARCWRWHLDGIDWPRRLIDTIFFWDRDKQTGQRHCELSFVSEREGRQMPPEARP